MPSKTFLIIDFQAKNPYTHHAYYISLYTEFLLSQGHKLIVALPRYTQIALTESKDVSVVRTLMSNIYGPSLKEKPFWFTLNLIVNAINPFYIQELRHFVRIASTRLYLSSPLRLIRKLVSLRSKLVEGRDELCILFPTADPLSLELMQICVKRFPHVKVFFRFVGGEQRGALTNPDVFKCFGMIQVHPNPVKIGFEVQAYKKFLFSQGIPSKLLHWAPPPLADRNSSYGASRIPNLGFLGMAKERKGFDQIPEIMLAFAKNGIKTSWTIQGTLFPWQTYTNTLEKINDIAKSHDFPLKLIPANVDLAELTSLLRGCDALVLPYDSESYAKNGSAIFYQAVELGVPMIAHSGLGFSDDLLSHNLGLTYTDVNEIPKIFQRLKADTIHFNQFIALTKSTNQTFLDL